MPPVARRDDDVDALRAVHERFSFDPRRFTREGRGAVVSVAGDRVTGAQMAS
jgi:hypothetical protein